MILFLIKYTDGTNNFVINKVFLAKMSNDKIEVFIVKCKYNVLSNILGKKSNSFSCYQNIVED